MTTLNLTLNDGIESRSYSVKVRVIYTPARFKSPLVNVLNVIANSTVWYSLPDYS